MSLNSDSKEKLYGVSALLKFMSDDNSEHPKDIFDEFKLHGRVALVTGSNGGIGLEIALVLAELGAKVWGVDLLSSASKEFQLCSTYAKILHQTNNLNDESSQAERLVYRQLDVTDEAAVQEVFQEIVSTDRRLDVCVAAAGILPPEKSCIEVKAGEFKQVLDVKQVNHQKSYPHLLPDDTS
ncbi:hypothetical protein O181_073511 [Austropuccinia psidii MF-1]|uniref:NAD(P)-binding protein n=1 Tax=Austropuccinia psidii MF-1 TaxID=1389203 RepID=A0A9Q3FB85_9BASI|nr:hypothetical protein [Austropuccinia psidii MF-1]